MFVRCDWSRLDSIDVFSLLWFSKNEVRSRFSKILYEASVSLFVGVWLWVDD